MNRRPRWVTWLFVALVLAVLAAVLFWELAPTASQPRAARVLRQRGAMRRWLPWLLVALALALLVAALLVLEQDLPVSQPVARVLPRRGGMNTPPSLWLLTGLMLGGLTVAGLALVQALQQARVLP